MPTPTRAKAPVPAWIIRERKRLGLKPRDLAERLTAAGLPVTEGTVRTWEAGRNPHPDNVEGLERIFGTRSPDYMGSAGLDDTIGSAGSAYLARIDSLVGLVHELVEQNAALMARIVPPPPDPIEERAAEALDELEGAEEPEQPRNMSRRPRSDRAPRAGAGSRGPREAESA